MFLDTGGKLHRQDLKGPGGGAFCLNGISFNRIAALQPQAPIGIRPGAGSCRRIQCAPGLVAGQARKNGIAVISDAVIRNDEMPALWPILQASSFITGAKSGQKEGESLPPGLPAFSWR
jgi:hypothetical protein